MTRRSTRGCRPARTVGILLFCCLSLGILPGCRSGVQGGENTTAPGGAAAAAVRPAMATGPAAAHRSGPMAVQMRNNMRPRPTRPN